MVVDGLREMDMGEWENLPLQELREERGKQLRIRTSTWGAQKNALKRFQADD